MNGPICEPAAMQRVATDAQTPTGTQGSNAAVALARQPRSIVTRRRFAAAPDQVWGTLLFYEQIEERPPLHLRLLLPRPIRSEGSKAKVGDEARCSYEGGHLLKRITQVDMGRHYGFEIVEQKLAVGGGLTLTGGGYTLRPLPGVHNLGVPEAGIRGGKPGLSGSSGRGGPRRSLELPASGCGDCASSGGEVMRAERQRTP